MDYFDIILAKKLNGGGGGDIDLQTLNVTENGTVNAPSGVAYNKVITNVPAPANAIYKQTLSGLPSPIATFTGADAPIDSLKASIEGVQDLHGYDSPWPAGGGKNKLVDNGYVQGVMGWNESTADSIVANNAFITSPYMPINNNTAYVLSAFKGNIVRIYITDGSHNKLYFRGNYPTEGNSEDIPATSGAVYIRISIGIDNQSVVPSDYGTKVYGQLELGSATTYEPYSNICPISGWTSCEVTDNNDTYTIPFKDTSDNPITVYGGGIDVTGGKLTVTHANIASYNGETINEPWISSEDVYTQGATPTTGAQVVYPLTTQLVYDFNPLALRSDGVTNISVNCGEVTELEYFSETP
jgi:hypothetical protein